MLPPGIAMASVIVLATPSLFNEKESVTMSPAIKRQRFHHPYTSISTS
jgi:hypothetical protein